MKRLIISLLILILLIGENTLIYGQNNASKTAERIKTYSLHAGRSLVSFKLESNLEVHVNLSVPVIDKKRVCL